MSKKLNNVLAKTLSSVSSSLQGKKKQNSRRRRRQRNGVSRIHPSGILAGYGSPISSIFHQRMTGDGLIVRGLDLVTSTFNPLAEDDVHLSFYMNANPANWIGTRISAISRAFQNYRPRKFVIHYRPQVGSTDDKSVFIGTLWQGNMIYGASAVEPSLLTSPGGTYLPSWQSASSVVPLGNRLPMQMFPIRDPPSSVVPFAVLVRSSDGGPSASSAEMPGRIFIEYEYEFRNAIGPSLSPLSNEGTVIGGVSRIRLEVVELRTSNDSQAMQTWIFKSNSSGQIPDAVGISGRIVDASGGPDSVVPMGGILSFDQLQASANINGSVTPRFVCRAKINDEFISLRGASAGSQLILYVDNQYGDPISPEPPMPSVSGSSSSASSRRLS